MRVKVVGENKVGVLSKPDVRSDVIDYIRPGQNLEVQQQLHRKGRVFFQLQNDKGFIPQFSHTDASKMVLQIQGNEARTSTSARSTSRNTRRKTVQASVAFEVTLSSPDVEAAERFKRRQAIYDDSGEFDGDISGKLCKLPMTWTADSFKDALDEAWWEVHRHFDKAGRLIVKQLNAQEEDFKGSFSMVKGGTWEFADENGHEWRDWGDGYPALDVMISRVLIEKARAR
mmetsp:Transcript_25559/g.58058  ORF Transcript_25559/g.58058 Transcript_25559/m.58058 type:complete len:229 (-) Transcript_25559:134-820(-)